MQKYFETKITELRNLKAEKSQSTVGKNVLIGAILDKVLETLNRQLFEMDFFKNPDIVCKKLILAPFTNLECESEFVKFDNRVKIYGDPQPSLRYQGKCSDDKWSTQRFILYRALMRGQEKEMEMGEDV